MIKNNGFNAKVKLFTNSTELYIRLILEIIIVNKKKLTSKGANTFFLIRILYINIKLDSRINPNRNGRVVGIKYAVKRNKKTIKKIKLSFFDSLPILDS